MEVPARKDPRKKKKAKVETRKSERPERARSEAVLIKLSEGASYAATLKNVKSRVNPEDLGVTNSRIREIRLKDLLVKVKCATKDRGKLDSVFRDVVGETESVRHLVPKVEVEILDIDSNAKAKEVAETVMSCLQEEPSSNLKVSMMKRPFRGTRKTFVRLKEERALILLKATHIKIGWVSCKARRKTEINRCRYCLGFGHMAADCQGPDRRKMRRGRTGYRVLHKETTVLLLHRKTG